MKPILEIDSNVINEIAYQFMTDVNIDVAKFQYSNIHANKVCYEVTEYPEYKPFLKALLKGLQKQLHMLPNEEKKIDFILIEKKYNITWFGIAYCAGHQHYSLLLNPELSFAEIQKIRLEKNLHPSKPNQHKIKI